MSNAIKTLKIGQGDMVLQEVWRIKDELSASYGHDVHRLFEETQRHERISEAAGRTFAALEPHGAEQPAYGLRDEPEERQDLKQREKMRELYAQYSGDRDKCVKAYAEAERRGEVVRKRNEQDMPSENYASALFADGIAKKWLR